MPSLRKQVQQTLKRVDGEHISTWMNRFFDGLSVEVQSVQVFAYREEKVARSPQKLVLSEYVSVGRTQVGEKLVGFGHQIVGLYPLLLVFVVLEQAVK